MEGGKEKEITPTILANFAVEAWRFSKVFEKVVTRLDKSEAKRYVSQYQWFQKRTIECLADAGLRFAQLEGQNWEPGMPAMALNLSEFKPEEELVIIQVIEPAILGPNGLVRSGTVTLGRAIE